MSARKRLGLFAVHVESDELQIEKQKLDDLPTIKEFQDVFLEDILGLPPHRDIHFSMDLVQEENLVSSVPY